MQDIEYLKSMYPSGIKILQGYVSEACDRLDYKNSPMYDEYPDHLMINRLCDSIYNTVISSEGPERVQSMWNITEADKSALEMAELKTDMQRLDIIPDYSDQGPDNNMVKAQDHNSEHIAESTSIRAVNTGGNGSRSSLLKNSNEFDNAIASGIVLVDFYADWCGPCKMLSPVIEGLAEKMEQVNFYKLNVDASSDIAGRYGVQAIPNLIIFKDGKAVDQITGFVPENEIVKHLQNLL